MFGSSPLDEQCYSHRVFYLEGVLPADVPKHDCLNHLAATNHVLSCQQVTHLSSKTLDGFNIFVSVYVI